MSNTRHIDLAKLAGQLRGQVAAELRPTPPQNARRRADSFPRIPAERFNELLDLQAAELSESTRVAHLRAMLPSTAPRIIGRPR